MVLSCFIKVLSPVFVKFYVLFWVLSCYIAMFLDLLKILPKQNQIFPTRISPFFSGFPIRKIPTKSSTQPGSPGWQAASAKSCNAIQRVEPVHPGIPGIPGIAGTGSPFSDPEKATWRSPGSPSYFVYKNPHHQKIPSICIKFYVYLLVINSSPWKDPPIF